MRKRDLLFLMAPLLSISLMMGGLSAQAARTKQTARKSTGMSSSSTTPITAQVLSALAPDQIRQGRYDCATFHQTAVFAYTYGRVYPEWVQDSQDKDELIKLVNDRVMYCRQAGDSFREDLIKAYDGCSKLYGPNPQDFTANFGECPSPFKNATLMAGTIQSGAIQLKPISAGISFPENADYTLICVDDMGDYENRLSQDAKACVIEGNKIPR